MTDPGILVFVLNIIVCLDGTPATCAAPARYNYGPYANAQECTAAVPNLQPLWPVLDRPARYAFECFGVRIR
jgi:hypothetical protein